LLDRVIRRQPAQPAATTGDATVVPVCEIDALQIAQSAVLRL